MYANLWGDVLVHLRCLQPKECLVFGEERVSLHVRTLFISCSLATGLAHRLTIDVEASWNVRVPQRLLPIQSSDLLPIAPFPAPTPPASYSAHGDAASIDWLSALALRKAGEEFSVTRRGAIGLPVTSFMLEGAFCSGRFPS